MSTLGDGLAGLSWWNGLSEADRRFWLAVACSAVPADAWEAYKRAWAALPPPMKPEQRGQGDGGV